MSDIERLYDISDGVITLQSGDAHGPRALSFTANGETGCQNLGRRNEPHFTGNWALLSPCALVACSCNKKQGRNTLLSLPSLVIKYYLFSRYLDLDCFLDLNSHQSGKWNWEIAR